MGRANESLTVIIIRSGLIPEISVSGRWLIGGQDLAFGDRLRVIRVRP